MKFQSGDFSFTVSQFMLSSKERAFFQIFIMITSSQNPRIQQVRKLIAQKKERDESGCYVLEGVRLIEEAMKKKEHCRLLLYTDPLSPRAEALVRSFVDQGVDTEEIAAQLMKTISDTESPQGVLAVMEMTKPVIPDKLDFIIIVDAIRDPGNLGTMIRTAAAAAADILILTPGCADPYAPKVLRSAMGTHFMIPMVQMDWGEIAAKMKTIPDLQVLASIMDGGKSCWDYDLCKPTALIIGSEANGISRTAQDISDGKIFIPMPGNIESLNAAMAAGILIFEVVRQRIKKD
ncbi:TrmH family RNA methyltransferase [Flexilinea flocculi]|nr:RNA methyltransferase [Flexilinea flocculi]